MNTVVIQVAVSHTTADWLDLQAQAAGKDPAQVAAALLEGEAQTGGTLLGAARFSPAERLRRFDATMARVPARPGPPVDVSRESLYD